ncbi:MAG TPA: hypothetical protein VHN11_14835 [Xanthobacteraceae bacterium]|nr:hypothetical protein [Xanthobacteraceae bacterium]
MYKALTADVAGSRRVVPALLAGLFGIALVFANSITAFADDDDDDDTFEQKIIKNVLGGLGMNAGGAGIDYRERSPLVLPPSRDLPPPDTSAGAASNPAWPNDADQRKKAKAEGGASTRSLRAAMDNQWLPGNELDKRGSSSKDNKRRADPRGAFNQDNGRQVLPSEIGYQGGIFDTLLGKVTNREEQAQFTGEPVRNSLTQPPAGYQTPSANYPYGLNPEAKKETGILQKAFVTDRSAGEK